MCLQNCADNLGPHTDEIEVTYQEKHRPQFHFTPQANWMNDPNGLVYYDGQWHLFYQHNPWGNQWGHMSWGHAVSRDLIHWGHMPIALYEEANKADKDTTMIFSGSAIVDKGNRSRICPDGTPDCMIAFYTSHVHNKEEAVVQHQSLAYSTDKGITWTKYDNNPVIDIGEKDFRDPKVFWHEQSQKWVMAVVLPKEYKVLFYGSRDLVNWQKLSEFSGIGDISKIWECPDLFELKVRNEPGVSKWVLLISGGGAQEGTFGMQYFIGNFDGQSFTLDEGETGSHYLDVGRDFYAAVTWNDDPYRRRLLIGWINNWDYGEDIPTSPWRSAQSVVRRLQMDKTADGYKLIQFPLKEIENIRGKYGGYTDLALPTSPTLFEKMNTKNAEIQVTFAVDSIPLVASDFGMKVFKSVDDNGNVLEETTIGYDYARQVLFIDKSKSGNTTFNEKFSVLDEYPIPLKDDKIQLHVLIDHSIIEIFVNGGELAMTAQVFPNHDQGGFELYATGPGRANADVFHLFEFNSIW